MSEFYKSNIPSGPIDPLELPVSRTDTNSGIVSAVCLYDSVVQRVCEGGVNLHFGEEEHSLPKPGESAFLLSRCLFIHRHTHFRPW